MTAREKLLQLTHFRVLYPLTPQTTIGGNTMKAASRLLLALALAVLPPSSHAQQNYTNVSAFRVVKFRILPGKTKDFYSYLSSIQKVLDAEKGALV